jgi:hypothetical protein
MEQNIVEKLRVAAFLKSRHIFLSFEAMTNLLFPMSMMTMLELECCLASSNHVVKWLNVSLRVISYTRSAPAAPR